jgi:hypothetical protein
MQKINLFAQAGYYIFFLFCLLLLLVSFITPIMGHYVDILAGVALLCPAGYFMNQYLAGLLSGIGSAKRLLLLAGICFAVKLSWVLAFRIAPENDYKMFFDTAAALSRSFVINSRYVALFPHIMGYSLFLSFFFSIFGVSTLLPPVLNVCLSVLAMMLSYYICRRLFGPKAAVSAALLWIVFPSQTIFNMQALSEPLYCTLLVAVWAVVVFYERRQASLTIRQLLLLSTGLSLLLVFFNMSRPLAMIQIIAFSAWLLLVNKTPAVRVKKYIFLLFILAFYALFSAMGNSYIALRLGEAPAGIPGYSMYVGFNAESKGAWNEKDASLLSSYNSRPGWSAGRTQRQMALDTLIKLRSGGINYPRLFYDKYMIFLGDDSSAVYYARASLRHIEALSVVSNIFYFFVVVFAVIGAVRAMRTGHRSPLFMICLYAVGLTLAHMLTEVAGRYHYSMTVAFLFLAAYGLNNSKAEKSAS